MIKYEIWDKKTPILGEDPDIWFNRNINYKTGDVIIVKVSGVIRYIEAVNIIRTLLLMPEESTTDEVAQQYINNLEKNQLQEPKQVQVWKAKEVELASAKLTLMKEGLI